MITRYLDPYGKTPKECMPKFWEAEPHLLSDMEKAFGRLSCVSGLRFKGSRVRRDIGV